VILRGQGPPHHLLAGMERLPCDRVYLAADPCTPRAPSPQQRGRPAPVPQTAGAFSLRAPRARAAPGVTGRGIFAIEVTWLARCGRLRAAYQALSPQDQKIHAAAVNRRHKPAALKADARLAAEQERSQ
jgi:hypothetical protein